MKNIICNSRWCPGPDGGPLYFSGSGATYDNLCVCGYRTCTTTLPEGGSGCDQYDPAIPVWGQQAITWGYVLRAVEAQDIPRACRLLYLTSLLCLALCAGCRALILGGAL